jgi:succinoglycan biosynthesis protein ExoU
MRTSGADARVAFIIPGFNAESTISTAIRSALNEPETHQVIVVDDGSQDCTATVARACCDGTHRLQVISLAGNQGPAAARNLAMTQVTAPWVGILDADDFMLPGRLGKLFGYQRGAVGVDFLADDLLMLDPDGSCTAPRALGLAGTAGAIDLDLPGLITGNMPHTDRPGREYGFLKPLIRREFLERHDLRYDPTLRLGEDWILYAHALARGARFRLVPACGYVYVVRPDSLSRCHGTDDLLRLMIAEDRLLALPGLSAAALAAFVAHRASTRHRFLYRVALDAKQRGQYLMAARSVFDSGAAMRYILRQSWQAKKRLWLAGLGRGPMPARRRPDQDPVAVTPAAASASSAYSRLVSFAWKAFGRG